MITVTHCKVQYTCSKAIKGPDYIHLVDANSNLLTAFDGVTDFSGFAISGGSWSSPQQLCDRKFALVHEDGSVHPSDFPVNGVVTDSIPFNGTILLTSGKQYGTSLPSSGVEGQLFFKI